VSVTSSAVRAGGSNNPVTDSRLQSTALVQSVVAIIVSYSPDLEELEGVLSSASNQVDTVVLIDNSPKAIEQVRIRELVNSLAGSSPPHKLVLVTNGSNLGLSRAYNQGVAIAKTKAAAFILLLDQDSRVAPGAISRLLAAFSEMRSSWRVGSVSCRTIHSVQLTLGPLVVLERLKSSAQAKRYSRGSLLRFDAYDELQTFTNTGTLIPIEVLDNVGPFSEELFLDAVDYDFSLRLRSRGYRCFMCRDAEINHRQGRQFERRLIWHNVQLRSYPSQRSYHIVRDTIRCARRWFGEFPGTVSSFVFFSAVGTLGALLLLPNHSQRARLVLKALTDSGRSHAENGAP
jgi:rhamnosyltransferase